MEVTKSGFWGDREVWHRYRLDEEASEKLLVKMLRQLFHEKGNRGRPPREVPQDVNICVEYQPYNRSLYQKKITASHEERLIQKGNQYDNEADLRFLTNLHEQWFSKKKISDVARIIQELAEGLMGLDLQSAEIEQDRYGNKSTATLIYKDCYITIQERR